MELIAALALGAILLVLAGESVQVLSDSRGRVAGDLLALGREGGGHRILRESFLMAQAVEAGASPFFGDASGATFRSRCRTAGGWSEACEVSLQIVAQRDISVLQVKLGAAQWVDVRRSEGQMRLRYLDRSSGTPVWRDSWGVSIARPHAVAVIAGEDVSLYLAGAP